MKVPENEIIEITAPGSSEMDRSWMISFWEVFTECIISTNERYVITNVRLKTSSGSDMRLNVGRAFPDTAAEKDKKAVRHELDMIKNGEVPFARFHFQSETGRYHRWTLVPFYNNGAFAGCHGVSVDVTEQTIKEITLNWQRAIIESGVDLVSITDMKGKTLFTNPGGYKMAGYDPSSGSLEPEYIFTPEYLNTINSEGMDTVIKHGSWSGTGELVRVDGTLLPIEHTMFSVRNDQDEAILIANIVRDVTAAREHESKLEKARKAAEAANVAKSEFLSRMSHEIRTPMNAILGMIRLAMDTEDLRRKDYCLMRADSASKHLLGIINNILDMSKIEADKFELGYSVFNFEKALRNVTNIANIRAEEKHQEFHVNLDYSVPMHILSDELRLSQVITNLLTNAIKFTPEHGSVTLSVKKTAETADDLTLRFEVSDTGIGITKEQQKKLFTSFNQADASISQNFGGTGLGLVISKRIVELMGGRIWIESELGKGSKFIFTLITKKIEGGSRESLYGRTIAKKPRILVTDDSEEIREYFLHLMEALHIECDVASDGRRALEMLESSKAEPYNIHFIDWQMPGMDGIELTRRVKEMSGDSAVVIMISSQDWNTIEKEAVSAGVDHFMPKPLFPSTLIDAINKCMGLEPYEDAAEARRDVQQKILDFSERTALIAEDVDINREIMTAVLTSTGLRIDYAENGKIAVDLFSADAEKYDLILMDINMPEMDGFEATRLIRSMEHPRAREIPIIAMTANVFREDVVKCLDAGMNDHIGKPIDAAVLFQMLEQYLSST